MKNKPDPRETALKRYALIAPLLEPALEEAEASRRRAEILERAPRPVSERTLRRHLAAYRERGFDGLCPKRRTDAGKPRAVQPEVLEEAAALKRELPQRSVRAVIEILEGEGRVKQGALRPSTLARHFAGLGLTEIPKITKGGFRRFQKEHRNCLWQADLKYGPYLPDPKNPGKTRRTYLLAFIDDFSRLVPHAGFYFEQKLPVLEDCLRKAILKRGVPDKIYVDQGRIFVSRWFRIACARLNIRHLAAKPYSPESKGKIERFMGTVDRFLAEARLRPLESLKELNEAFCGWLEEGYNHHPHSALDPGETPASTFAGDTKKIRFASLDELRAAFLWEEDRKVDKTGCLKLGGRVYDAGPELAGKTVEVRFDPFAPDEVEVWIGGRKDRTAGELVLNQPRQAPQIKPSESSGRSRYLDVLAQKEKERRKRKLGAISFRDMGGGGRV
jgi:transposase InsO family protein